MAISNNIETWKILLIEDNPLDTKVIQETLKDASSKIKLAITDRLSTGMAILQDENFDALLLDLNLPDAMGLEALNKILNFTTDLPIIILTGLADEELGSKAIREGAQDYLFKGSVDTPLLTRSIRYAIERKQVEKQLQMKEERIRENQKNLKKIFDTIHTGVVIIDQKTHQIIDANSKAVEMIGASEEDIVNTVCHKFICPTNKGQCPVTDLGKKVDQSERILLTARGEVIPIIKSVTPVTLSGHEYLVESFTDISDRKSIENDLMKSKARLRFLLRKNPAVIYTCKPHGDFETTFMSENIRELVGYEVQEFLEVPNFWVTIMHPEDKERIFASFSKLPQKGYYNEIYRILHKDGVYRWVLEEARLIKNDQGEPLEIVGYWTDISKLKQKEFELYNSEKRNQQLVDNASDIIFSLSPDGIIISLNRTFDVLTGLRREEFIGKQFIKLLHPDDIPTSSSGFESISLGGKIKNIGMRITTKSNEFIILEGRVTPHFNNGELIGFVGVARDITEQKRIVESLRESEEKYRLLVEKSSEGIAIIQDRRYKYVNSAFSQTVGYSIDELIKFSPDDIWSLIHPDDKESLEKRNRDLEAGQILAPRHNFRYIRGDGSIRWVEAFGTEMLFGGRSALQVFETDITERKLVEMKLRESEEKYRTILENMDEGYFEVDLDGNLTFFNDSLAKSLGYSEDELIGMNNRQYMDDKNAKKVYQTFNEVYKTGISVKAANWEIIRKDGTKRFHEDSISIIMDSRGNPTGFRGIARDITDRKQAEQELQRSETNLREAQRIAHLGSWDWNIETNNLSWSDEVFRIFGLNSEKVNPSFETFMRSIHPCDREFVKKSTNDALYKNKSYNIEYRIVRPDGEVYYVHEQGEVIYSEIEQPISMIGTIHEITERKILEGEIKFQSLDLEERLKELNCLYSVSKLTKETERSLKEVFLEVIDLFTLTWQYPEITCARIIFEEKTFTTDNFRETIWKLSANIDLNGNRAGIVEIFYLEEKPSIFEGPFLKEERNLIDAVAKELGDFIKLKRAQEALEESEERYRTLFEDIPIGLYQTTPDGRFIAANSAFLEMLGYNSFKDISQLGAHKVAEQIGYSRDKFLMILDLDDEARGLEQQIHTIDKAPLFIRENTKAIKNEYGAILYYEGSFEDISERKRAEVALVEARDILAEKVNERTRELFEEKKRIETIIRTVPVGILVLDPDGSLSLVNKTFEELYNKIFNEEVPLDLNINDRSNHIFFDEIKSIIHSRKPNPKIIELIKGNFYQIISQHMSFEENLFGILIELYDVSPFIEFEITQKQFVATVSHELRTPITILDLSIKNLQKYWEKMSEKQREEVFSLIIKSSISLKQIIEDILIISKIESRELKLEMTTFKLGKVLNNITAQFDSRLREFSVILQLEIHPSLEICGDTKRIGKIFSILLDNAIKFSPDEESTVKIIAIDEYRGAYNPEDVHGVLIQVIDSGKGIPENDIPHIFDRFYKSIDTKDAPGVGIGLFIAKTLVNHHQGQIFVRSKIGKGSTFSVFLPRLEVNSR